MSRKQKREEILTVAVDNAEQITEIMKNLDALIPEKSKAEAEKLWTELQHRMFYQDYLYDCHGSLLRVPARTIILNYKDYDRLLKSANVW